MYATKEAFHHYIANQYYRTLRISFQEYLARLRVNKAQ